MINEELLEKWIEADHELLTRLRDLMIDGEQARARYAEQSSERMKELNKMVSNNLEQTKMHQEHLNKELVLYIQLLEKAIQSCNNAQVAETEALKALAHAQKENDRLNTQIETLQSIIKNLSNKSRPDIEINQK